MPLDKIPVTFTYNGKEYKGILDKVSGAGSGSMYHLYVDNFYWGQLWQVENGWQFASNQHKDLESLTDYFADVVIAWYQ